MLFNKWKSIVICWVDTLDASLTPVNFISDISVEVFHNICSYIDSSVEINTIEDAYQLLKGFYPSLVLGEETEENLLLLGTCYLILTSIHCNVSELCTKSCDLPLVDQKHIRNMLESFIGIPPTKITKELVYSTIAKLPDNLDSVPNSPNTVVFSGTPSSTENRFSSPGSSNSRRSSSLKKVRHRLRNMQCQNEGLQEELDGAKEAISNLEFIIKDKNKEISQLKRLCSNNVEDGNLSSQIFSWPQNSPPVTQNCVKCKSLEKQMTKYEEELHERESGVTALSESVKALKKKITSMEVEKRVLEDQLRGHAEQVGILSEEMKNEIRQRLELLSANKELEAIIQEIKESNKIDRSQSFQDMDVPQSLANEIVDIQKVELQMELETKEIQLQELIEEKSHLTASLDEKNGLLEEVSIQVTALREAILKKEEETNSLRHELSQITQSNDKLKVESAQKSSEIEKITRDLNGLDEKSSKLISELESQITKLKVGLTDQTVVLGRYQEEVESLVIKASALEKSLLLMEQEKEQTRDSFTKRLDELLAERRKSVDEIKIVNAKLQSLEREKLLIKDELSLTKVEVSQLNEELLTLNKELQSTKQNYKDDVKRHQSTINEYQEVISSATARIQSLENKSEEAERTREELILVLSERDNSIADLKCINDDLSQQIKVEKNKCESFLLQITLLNEELRSDKEEIIAIHNALNVEVNCREAEVAAKTLKISRLQQEIDAVVSQNELSFKKVEDLEKIVVSRSEKLRESELQISTLQHDLNVLNEKQTKLKEESETTIANLTSEIRTRDVEIASYGSNAQTLQSKVKELEECKRMCEALELELSNKGRELLLVGCELSQLKGTLEKEVASSTLAIDRLREELESMTGQKESLASRFMDIEGTKALTEETLNKSEQMVIQLRHDLEKAYKELSLLRDEHNKSSKSLIEEIESRESVIVTQMTELTAKEAKIEELTFGIENLKRTLENTNMDLDIKTETILMIEATNNNLNHTVNYLEGLLNEKSEYLSTMDRDMQSLRTTFHNFKENCQEEHLKRMSEMKSRIVKYETEMSSLQKDNQLKCDQILKMAEELVQVSQTFNVEKTSLLDHTKNVEELLSQSMKAEKELKSQVASLRKTIDAKDDTISSFNERISILTDKFNSEKTDLLFSNDYLKTELNTLSSNYNQAVNSLEDTSVNLEQFEKKTLSLTKENEELKRKLAMKVDDIEKYGRELEILQKSTKNTISINSELEKEIQAVTLSRKEDVSRLEIELAAVKDQNKRIEAQVRQEYEKKLERLKEKLRVAYAEKLEEAMKNESKEIRYLKSQLSDEKKTRSTVEQKMREMSDQLLILQEENRTLISTNVFRQPMPISGPISYSAYETPPLYKAQSLDRFPALCQGLDNLGADVSLNSSTSSRRTSTSSSRSNNLPRGIGKIFHSTGKVFPSADEEGEVFDNRCLADLKAGICSGPSGRVDRMSVLQQRNSMCPPHLKSSYPVETQFVDPRAAKEDEIKSWHLQQKENQQPRESISHRKVSVTPSKLKALFSSRRKD